MQSCVQARISATKGGGEAPAGAKPAPTSANPPTEKLGVVQTQPLFDSLSVGPPAAGLSSPFATPGGGAGVFSSSASFLDDEGNQARTGADDEGAAWLEREKEQRERRERARREEEERWVDLVKSLRIMLLMTFSWCVAVVVPVFGALASVGPFGGTVLARSSKRKGRVDTTDICWLVLCVQCVSSLARLD